MYVLIGASAAAAACIEAIRETDKTTPVTVVTQEEHWRYARPLISYYLEGRTKKENLPYHPDTFSEANGVTVKAGVRAEKLDAAAHTVTLADGEMLPYQKLLVATGSRPFVPPLPGLEQVKQHFSFLTLDDAEALAAALTPQSRVLILGAGLTGVKCAEGIAGRCAGITLADLAPRVLPAVLDDESAALVQKHMEAHGVRFYLGDGVQRFENGNTAVLASGARAAFDVLVTAVGVRANTQLVADAGGEVRRGIVVDTYCRTTLPDVYAAGDCTEGYDAVSGEVRSLPLWPSASLQGETAGHNMAGGCAALLQDMAVNATGVFGLHMITAGSYEGESFVTRSDGNYKRLVTGDGVLKGVIMVGDVARAGIYTNLIRTRRPLAEIDFELIREKPQLMAFSQADRTKQLGGEV